MRKFFVYCLILFCAIVLQTSVLPLISPAYATGDVLLMFVLAGAILDGFFGFFWWAIFAGIMYDLASYTVVGVHALVFLLVIYFVSFFSRRFSIELRGVGLALFLLFIVVATVLLRGVIFLMASWDFKLLGGALVGFGSLKTISIQILSNVVLFFFIFVTLRKIKKFFTIE